MASSPERGVLGRRPILVTGNGRSGTTWLGETLSRAPGVRYYKEPCHPLHTGAPREAVDGIWSRVLMPGDRDPYFEAALGSAFSGGRGPGLVARWPSLARLPGARRRIVVKEVAAFASTEWVARRWDPHVLVILRHPGAYAASVRALGNDAGELARLRLLAAAPRLAETSLAGARPRLERIATPLEAAAAAWAIRTRLVLDALARHPEWLVVTYEELARAPVEGFRSLYGRLGLSWTEGVERWVTRSTAEDAPGTATTRRSASRIDRWRTMLAPAEIAAVRRTVEPFGLGIYDRAEDWAPVAASGP